MDDLYRRLQREKQKDRGRARATYVRQVPRESAPPIEDSAANERYYVEALFQVHNGRFVLDRLRGTDWLYYVTLFAMLALTAAAMVWIGRPA